MCLTPRFSSQHSWHFQPVIMIFSCSYLVPVPQTITHTLTVTWLLPCWLFRVAGWLASWTRWAHPSAASPASHLFTPSFFWHLALSSRGPSHSVLWPRSLTTPFLFTHLTWLKETHMLFHMFVLTAVCLLFLLPPVPSSWLSTCSASNYCFIDFLAAVLTYFCVP